jgi:hypothetical protein
MKYRIHIGKSRKEFHSYRDLDTFDDAIAYLWAMANIPVFERCWQWQRGDGWMRNDHMRGKAFPPRLEKRIKQFIREDELAVSTY